MWIPFKNKVRLHNFSKEILKTYRKLEKGIISSGGSIYPATNYRKHYENARREFRRKWSLFGK